jgi:hypothetical protein
MVRRFASAVVRAVSGERPRAGADVHFHSGPDGPYVCEAPRCESPGLDPRDFRP